MKLYEIKRTLIDQLNNLSDKDEVTDQDIQSLAIAESELKEKAESYIAIINKLKAEKETFLEYKKQAEMKANRIQTKIDWLEKNLLDAAQTFGDIDTPLYTVTTRRSTYLHLESEENIPTEYVKTKTTIDRAALTRAIKEGKEVEGATIQERFNLRIK